MSLTVREACAVNDVLARWLGRPDDSTPRPSSRDVADSVALLAGAAHRRLSAGWTMTQAVEAVRAMLAREAESKVQTEAAFDETVIVWELAAARAIVMQLDGTRAEIDDQEWALDAIDEPDPDEITITHQSGRAVLVRVSVQVVEGALS